MNPLTPSNSTNLPSPQIDNKQLLYETVFQQIEK